MTRSFVAPVLGAAVLLVSAWNGRTADLQRPIKAAYTVPVDILPVFAVAPPKLAAPEPAAFTPDIGLVRFTAAVLRPSMEARPVASDARLGGFSGSVQHAGFDLDLTRLYRHDAAAAAVIPLPASGSAGASQALATWDMPLPITPADRNLTSRLQTRADAALATRIALLTGPTAGQ